MKFIIEEIQQTDDQAICQIIKDVGVEYGAIGEGFGPSDDEVLTMSKFYNKRSKSMYFVAKIDDVVVGGCGIAPFNDSYEVCELKKLFLLPDSRGLGIGRKLTEKCLDFAQSQDFKSCYLDTLQVMNSAILLYESIGFQHLDKPLAGSEHGGCDVWMLKHL
ncbi:GNAT family N-acetyltransferase [Oceanisphaera sp. KMM 10153]|uniref:GNAT family N-acetyltransferase n=1 Tax=Oceanisphaera submarina TaxID=3390193 RepID=UPI00397568C6